MLARGARVYALLLPFHVFLDEALEFLDSGVRAHDHLYIARYVRACQVAVFHVVEDALLHECSLAALRTAKDKDVLAIRLQQPHIVHCFAGVCRVYKHIPSRKVQRQELAIELVEIEGIVALLAKILI